jgi:Glyoxalase-like domain
MTRLDHLVYAVPDVDAAVDELAARLGVRASATVGGTHPGLGTRNAIVGLGPDSFLEIIGPSGDGPPRWFGIEGLHAPRLVAWAAKGAKLQHRLDEAAAGGFPLGPIEAGSRVRTDGSVLSWRFTHPRILAAGGVVPFFIDWGEGAHSAGSAPQGVTLKTLRAEHPSPAPVLALLRRFEIDLRVEPGAEPRLFALLDTPRGPVELS